MISRERQPAHRALRCGVLELKCAVIAEDMFAWELGRLDHELVANRTLPLLNVSPFLGVPPFLHTKSKITHLLHSQNGVWGLGFGVWGLGFGRSEEHTSELQSQSNLVCRLLLEKKEICKL